MADAYVRDEVQTFQPFPWFPRELRDAIWRACLPRRVVEIDIPFGYVSQEVWPLDDNDGEVLHVGEKARHCYMESTTRINSAPPIISRVCRESRMVAFETGRLLKHKHRKRGDGPDISPHVDQQWFDPARDTVHLHYNIYIQRDRLVLAQGNPICILHERAAVQRVPVSLTYDLIDGSQGGSEWVESMALLEDLGEVAVCLEVVSIHIDERPAVQSGLFGTLGEERVVLADALDHELITKFRTLWKVHRLCNDPLTEAFFEQHENDVSVITEEHRVGATVREAVKEIQMRWILTKSNTHDAKGSGKLLENIWESGRAGLPLSGERPVPNLRHPWVKETYSQMPKFRPTMMFRLCTNQCMDVLNKD